MAHQHDNMYQQREPEHLLGAVESTGLSCDGRLIELNSYENRVYQLGLQDGGFVIAKFYRHGRWSDDAILEDHQFTLALQERDISVVAPMRISGNTLHHHESFRFALFPRQGGRWPELDHPTNQARIGRLLGRLHTLGRTQRFKHRPHIQVKTAQMAIRFLLEQGFIPTEMITAYRSLTTELVDRLEKCLDTFSPLNYTRLHGDCHPGNILWSEESVFLVDFDDCLNGPAVQDLWMLLSGDSQQITSQFLGLLEGYREFADFDLRELNLIEPLRTFRLLNYAAWLAQRWSDPAFPRAFPWFNTRHYWEQHLQQLREQAMLLDDPPLCLDRLW